MVCRWITWRLVTYGAYIVLRAIGSKCVIPVISFLKFDYCDYSINPPPWKRETGSSDRKYIEIKPHTFFLSPFLFFFFSFLNFVLQQFWRNVLKFVKFLCLCSCITFVLCGGKYRLIQPTFWKVLGAKRCQGVKTLEVLDARLSKVRRSPIFIK